MLAGEEYRAMERDDRLARPCRPGNPCRSSVVTLHQLALGWVQEDRPFIPWVIQGSFELFHITHDTEAALSVGVGERVDPGQHNTLRNLWLTARRQLEQ